MFTINGATEIEQMKRLCGKFSLSPVRLARGKSTNLLLAENEISEHRGFKIKVADTIGADDSGILN